MVYTFDNGSRNLVKIVKRGKRWAVYQLKEIQWWDKVFADYRRSTETRYKFIWEKKAINTYSYKPFEDADVTNYPDSFISDVKRWQPHKLSYRGKGEQKNGLG
ncbi:MAG: hypothetical protein KAX49_14035 [Halanaerobiales bacterium]|nr:hypothetical protein [Halanaerobiales bacterium]